MIKVIHAGLQSSVQDLGRFGYAKYGVPTSGVMDETAFKIGNVILKNDVNAACIETAFGMLQLQFLQPTIICITGADFSPKINQKPIDMYKPVEVNPHDLFTFGKRNFGIYTNIHVKGGMLTDEVLGSKSFYHQITNQSILKKDDLIPFAIVDTNVPQINVEKPDDQQQITSHKGPEYDLLSKHQQEKLKQVFSISSNCNRMGFVLNEKIEHQLPSIISSAVLPGTVQLTPNGSLIVLHKDAQTVGGYPRVLQLTAEALSILSQKFTNDKIQLNIVDL